jgi:hypothetical protein
MNRLHGFVRLVMTGVEKAFATEDIGEAAAAHLLTFLRRWITQYPNDFLESNELHSRTETLLARLSATHSAARNLHAILRAQVFLFVLLSASTNRTLIVGIQVDATRQQRRASEDALMSMSSTTIDRARAAVDVCIAARAIDVARQLTLIESQIYAKVHAFTHSYDRLVTRATPTSGATVGAAAVGAQGRHSDTRRAQRRTAGAAR